MKLVVTTLFCLMILSCKEAPKEKEITAEAPKTEVKADMSKYPETIQKVFEAHGGLDTWKAKRVLSFEIPKKEITEKHTIDLYTRDEKIEMPGASTGSEGEKIWLLDNEGVYKSDPVFHHNLMFYFYAMPFVLADKGVVFSDTEPLDFEGKSYPGIRISYNDGVGLSSKDEYFIHYNPENYQMEWLGYTVTFRSGEKSDNVKWIRYNDLKKVDGLLLPNSLTWHNYEGRTIKEAREPMSFKNIALSESKMPTNFFDIPETAKIVRGETE